MGASNKFFLDKRETEEHQNFDHNTNYLEKLKFDYLSDTEFREAIQGNLFDITDILIKEAKNEIRIDTEYLEKLVERIEELEPVTLKSERSAEYFFKVKESGIENMKRVYKKYDNINYYISKIWKMDLESSILEDERKNK